MMTASEAEDMSVTGERTQEPTSSALGFLGMVSDELRCAREQHPRDLTSLHHGYAVLLEELEEFWDEVRRNGKVRDRRRCLEELVQVAAMAQRIAEDVLRVPQAVNGNGEHDHGVAPRRMRAVLAGTGSMDEKALRDEEKCKRCGQLLRRPGWIGVWTNGRGDYFHPECMRSDRRNFPTPDVVARAIGTVVCESEMEVAALSILGIKAIAVAGITQQAFRQAQTHACQPASSQVQPPPQ